QKASKNLIMLLLYLRARFEFLNQDFFDGEEAVPNIPGWYLHQFYTAEDYYEENPYFQAILESFPTAEFVAGWSTVLPEYDEVYAIIAMTEESEN
ncbi:MAG TPA: hypothetical protein VHQ24_07780, partial [Lachnospiraceae bacterium]|nr:hypothetical protein [Lachnospiraceae bacterium]